MNVKFFCRQPRVGRCPSRPGEHCRKFAVHSWTYVYLTNRVSEKAITRRYIYDFPWRLSVEYQYRQASHTSSASKKRIQPVRTGNVNKSYRNITREKYRGEIFHNSIFWFTSFFFVRFKGKSPFKNDQNIIYPFYLKNRLKFFFI